jgi:hypothetical protein
MNTISRCFTHFRLVLIVVIANLFLAGCAIKAVADYDPAVFEEIITVAKKVDRFYGGLLESPSAARKYRQYAERYVEIETDLRWLYMRNRARYLNAESTCISEIILDLWRKYKGRHESTDGYSDGNARLDRDRFNRLFVSAMVAENEKKLNPGDIDPYR